MSPRRQNLLVASWLVAAVVCLLYTATAVGQTQAHAQQGAVGNRLIQRWELQYGCPASATRLPPITVEPPTAFSPNEACGVVWMARDAWIGAAPPGGIPIRDTEGLSGVLVEYRPLLVRRAGSSRYTAQRGFVVYFARSPDDSTVAVQFDPTTNTARVVVTHSLTAHRRLTESRRRVDSTLTASMKGQKRYSYWDLRGWQRLLEPELAKIQGAQSFGVNQRQDCVHVGMTTAFAVARAKHVIAHSPVPANAFCVVLEEKEQELSGQSSLPFSHAH
jgi:hypothetical protein